MRCRVAVRPQPGSRHRTRRISGLLGGRPRSSSASAAPLDTQPFACRLPPQTGSPRGQRTTVALGLQPGPSVQKHDRRGPRPRARGRRSRRTGRRTVARLLPAPGSFECYQGSDADHQAKPQQRGPRRPKALISCCCGRKGRGDFGSTVAQIVGLKDRLASRRSLKFSQSRKLPDRPHLRREKPQLSSTLQGGIGDDLLAIGTAKER